jgi:hypothetical protein
MGLKTVGGLLAALLVTLACGISAYDIHLHFSCVAFPSALFSPAIRQGIIWLLA